MLDLENLGVVEMNAREIKEVAGGWGFNLSIFGFSIVSYGSKRPSDDNWRTDLW